MKISVWDTYVRKEDNSMMHFDILVPSDLQDQQIIFGYGADYLKSKPFKTKELSANQCRFCHTEQASQKVIDTINKKGYAIIEMENCN
ncbi:uncharacterized protein DUF2024 [Flavobacteriaceae bacterium MAR_2010_105]|nr:uncharacterized protein DUF2024 [Flavobacteriaceae bacterium MAR_2010_105]